MGELIAFRALQGIGGGGLVIGAQTIVGDVVAPADRGRYQGLFGALFGVTTVLGPLAGGLLVDNASWRWVFYINIPVGVVALQVTGAFLPAAQRRVSHVIDYVGAALVTARTTCLVLMTSLGGTTYAWGSPHIVTYGVAGGAVLGVDDVDGEHGPHEREAAGLAGEAADHLGAALDPRPATFRAGWCCAICGGGFRVAQVHHERVEIVGGGRNSAGRRRW